MTRTLVVSLRPFLFALAWLVAAQGSAQAGSPGAPTVAGETRVEPSLPPTSIRVSGVVLEVGCVVNGAVRAGDRVFVSCTGGRIRGFAALASGGFALVEERRAPGEISALFVAEGSAWALSNGEAVAVAELPTVEITVPAPGASTSSTAAAGAPLPASGPTGATPSVTSETRAPARSTARSRTAPAADRDTDRSTAADLSRFPLRDRHGRTLVDTRHENQPDRGLWGTGLGLFLAGWVLDIVGTAIFNAASDDRSGANEEDAQAWSLLPIVGPLVQLGIEAPHPALPLTSGLLQISGLVLFVVGMTSNHDVEIPVYAWGDPHDAATARLGLDITPTNGGAYASLTLHAM